MKNTPPSAYFYTFGTTYAEDVAAQLGMNDWDALEQKPGRVAVADEVFGWWDGNYDAAAAAWLTYNVIATNVSAITFATRTGREILSALEGEYLSIQHILSRGNLADVYLTLAENDVDKDHKIPIWAGTYAFDLEEYPLAVADMGAMQVQRGGGEAANTTTNSEVLTITARGRFLSEAPTRRREWFMVYGDNEVHLPRGRYHFIAVCNPKGDNANQYTVLTVTGPDIAVNAVTGATLQRAFLEDYAPNYWVETAGDFLEIPDVDVAFIEDIIQPIYWGGPESMKWESGVNGPITIRSATADPAMYVYALRCVE